MPTYTGNDGNNTINGGNGDDTIFGQGGDDTLSGGNGNDTISGGDGSDGIDGGNGNDTIDGGNGNDTIDGGNGDDAISGGNDNDIIYGGNGGDGLLGGGGDDELYGQNGDDRLTGGAGNDLLDGNNGFDIAYYSGAIGEYSFFAAAGYLHVVHLGGAGADGHDRLIRVERLVFADRVIDLTGGGNNAPVAGDDHVSITEDTGTYSSGAASVKDNDFDFEGQPLTVTGGVFTGTYGTLTLNANGTYSYTLNASAQALAQGQNVTDSFNYTVSDGAGSDTGALVFHIAGVNDAPVAHSDTAAAGENATILINVLANDTDIDNGAVLTVTTASAPSGQGTASVVGNQVQFNPGTDFDHLAQGATATVVVNYSILDQFGASSSSTVSVTVTGANDGPAANPGTASTSENAGILVNVLANDSDVDDGAVLTLVAASSPSGQGSASVVSNQVQFNPGTDFDDLAVGQSEEVVVSYSIQDEHGAAASSTLSITVTGTNDGPVANPDTGTTSENVTLLVDVLANDTDVDNGAVLAVTTTSAPSGEGTASVVGNQVQFDPGTDFDYLAVGESTNVVVGYSMQDEHGASSSSSLTITVTGTNDAPTIVAGGTDATGSVTELPNNDPNENAFTHTDSGAVAFADVDLSDIHSASFTPQGGGYLGTFTLDPVNQAGDTVGWDFSVADNDLDALDDGETLTQTYTVQIDDGHGGTVTQDVTITLTGAADGPQTEWYIDNSAVGSTNVGTQADPFTSIAAFNAAQGTVGGPQTAATVYLLAGLGTYAETDGINLLDDQILTGVASGPLRPTIVATGGDGIDVAHNNTISGLDVGNTSGADIADSGTSVGTLTINDVGTSGTGQIIDVDQGGTLNVTLNSASSTGSSGGAIDLDGVGGSFTVTGATTITGLHTGGGIDITGSSLAASFAGGGAIATGTTTAVNFVGNSGSLALGGGLDIVTTTGAGLVASGGGTVTATGAGNSVTSTTGTAIAISGTIIGAADLTFESVSASGGGNGIVLSNTGSLGGLHVTGAGTAGSGGTIQNETGAGILLTDTSDTSLAWMTVQNGGDDGIRGSNVAGFTLANSTVVDNGNGSDENGLDFTNLTGTAVIEDTLVRGSYDDNFRLTNSAGTLDSLNITGSTFDHLAIPAAGGDGVQIALQGTAVLALASISESTFRNNFSDGILVSTENTSRIGDDNPTSSATTGIVIGNNTFDDNNTAIQANVFNSSDLTIDIEGNSIVNDGRTDPFGANSTSTAIVLGSSATAAAGSTLNARVEDNVIGDAGIDASGSSNGSALRLVIQGLTDITATIDNNTVREAPLGFGFDIELLGSPSGTPPISDVTITNNDVDHTNDAYFPGISDFPLPAIYVVGDNQGTAGQLDVDVRGNTVPSGFSYNFTGGMIELVEYSGPDGDLHLVDNPVGPGGETAADQLASSNFGSVGVFGDVALDIIGFLPQPPDLTMI